MNDEDVLDALAARVLVYRIFNSIFGSAPNVRQLEIAASEPSRASMCLLGGGATADAAIHAFARRTQEAACDVDAVRRSYDRLFVGPGPLPAPPWESVYVCGERLLFQESTLMVRKEYLDQGLLPSKYPHVADDHLALEMDFMAALGERARVAFEENDMRRMVGDVEASKRFLTQHLRKWLPMFLGKLEEHDTRGAEDLYVHAARILNMLTAADEALLDRLIVRSGQLSTR